MSDAEPGPEHDDGLADRYGSARRSRLPSRRTLGGTRGWVLGTATALALLVGGYVVYTQFFAVPLEAQRVAFEPRPGNAMEVTVDVTRDDPSRPAVCIVRVRDISGAESGRKEIYVAPGGVDVERLNTTVRSIGEPVTADVHGCSYDVPEYLSSPQRPTE
ncbi:DUF4307 domain-containing protein [Saccharomonospora piscinae]|uniref:DUF4307 domain-containing protein n=1 Tax=Saccharomonospora piscinae TaxID=687388 RepID=UPI00110673C7|nr:DUF4307 domain-containing protein [Saccharomonospora piscinae]TLW91826.1 DUF4307 domain-containing protein [Saccharomonospora piscinae]